MDDLAIAARQMAEAMEPTLVSELLLAQRLAAGDLRLELRYLPHGSDPGWRIWDGSCYIACPDAVPIPLSAAIHIEAGKLIREGFLEVKAARTIESTASMRAVLTQLLSYPRMRFELEEIDPPYQIATLDGLFNFKTAECTKATPEGPAFLHRTAVAYDPLAEHPLWNAIADHVALIPSGGVIQRFLGASLMGVPPDRKFIVLHGDGADGKGTLLRTCVMAAGTFGAVLPTEALSGEGRGAHGHELLNALSSARLAWASEVPAHLDWPLIKSVSGGDPRTSKRMYGRASTTQVRAWLALATNTKTVVPDQAAADRCIVIRWFKPTDPNPEIAALIAIPGPERDAFLRACLRWLIQGASEFLRDGLGVPDYARPKIEPEGLAGWWSACEGVSIVKGGGWTAVQPLADHAIRWHEDQGLEPPTSTAIGTFLGSRLARRRQLIDGRKVAQYAATIIPASLDGVGRG